MNAMTLGEAKAHIRQHVQKREWDRAFSLGLDVLQAQPNHDDLWQVLRHVAPKLPVSCFRSEHLAALHAIVERSPSSPGIAALLALQALCARYPVFAAHLQLLEAQVMTAEGIDLKALAPFFGEPLFHALLRRMILPHTGMERFLTALRRRLLVMPGEEGERLEAYREVLTSLAIQGYTNGYVYYRTQEEENLLESWRRKPQTPDVALLLACYRPPIGESGTEDSEFGRFAADMERQRQREADAASRMETLGEIGDAVSQAVRAQYEEHPYPRWVHLPEIPEETPHGLMKRLFPRFDASALCVGEKPRILIAGCGTGRQALEAATRFASAQVTAVDLCRASLAYAACKTEDYRVANIRYIQADILRLAELGERFDIVESCGVLHHMRDTMAGWRVLVDALKPGGLMKIALYSATARKSIAQCRNIIRGRGIGDSEAEIRGFRHELMQSSDAQRAYPFMRAVDFFSMPECRDLLFHRQEHCFTLPEISDAIGQLGLKLIGFDVPGQAMIERYIARFPQDPYWNDLDNWHQLEQEHPLLFFGMYQFWCYSPSKFK